MRRLLLVLCVMCMLFASMSPCLAAGSTNGVLAEKRVINLPNDQGKWYLSVVGEANDAQYQKILVWFKDTDSNLYKLRQQVHYIPVSTSKPVYKMRYKPNIQGLPTVRLQDHAGVVVYEACGDNLPFTPEGLYGALANDVAFAQRCIIRPWRRQNRRGPCPGPCPNPNPTPDPDLDSDPDPGPIDDGGRPDLPARSGLPPLWAMLLTLIVSAGAGGVVEWRATYAEK